MIRAILPENPFYAPLILEKPGGRCYVSFLASSLARGVPRYRLRYAGAVFISTRRWVQQFGRAVGAGWRRSWKLVGSSTPIQLNPNFRRSFNLRFSNMRWHRLTLTIPLVPTALALAMRLYGLSDKPLWLDEIITQRRANRPILDLIANSLSHGHFPTYFLFIRAFDAPMIDEWMLRLPSAIFGSVSVLLVVLIATEVRSPRAGAVAGILMALSPLEVQFAAGGALLHTGLMFCPACTLGISAYCPSGLVRCFFAEPTVPVRSAPPGLRLRLERLALSISYWWRLHGYLRQISPLLTILRHSGPKRAELVRKWALTQAIIVLA